MVTTDTILRGIFGLRTGAKPPAWLERYPYIVNLYAHLANFYERLSYVADWRDAFCQSSRLDVEVCNINNLVHLARCLVRIRRYDLVVVSHVAIGDDMTIMPRAAAALARRKCPMLVFIGNEYDLLDEKISFIQAVRGGARLQPAPARSGKISVPGRRGWSHLVDAARPQP